MVALLDEAYDLQPISVSVSGGRTRLLIDMKRVIGTEGETIILLVLEGKKVKTAYPVFQ